MQHRHGAPRLVPPLPGPAAPQRLPSGTSAVWALVGAPRAGPDEKTARSAVAEGAGAGGAVGVDQGNQER